jgi:hypothetical protein
MAEGLDRDTHLENACVPRQRQQLLSGKCRPALGQLVGGIIGGNARRRCQLAGGGEATDRIGERTMFIGYGKRGRAHRAILEQVPVLEQDRYLVANPVSDDPSG